MTAPAQLALQARPHRNQGLFSDHYLDGVLPVSPDWAALRARAAPVMEEIAGIYARHTPGGREAVAEHELVRPVLELLGHTFEVQPALDTPGGPRTPDYIFYRDRAALDANRGRKLTDELPRQGAYAVGEAEHWDAPLDRSLGTRRGSTLTNTNPSFQISSYIQHSGLEWGVLTNGRLWRLYHRDTAHKLDRYYEVDLRELAAGGDIERFLYFYAFFRQPAFDPGPLGVSEVLRASQEYARGVGESLKIQVYDALRHLAQGFLDHPSNRLEATPETLREIYGASLIVLYRLLFILYAEARELLPVSESEDYRESYSLRKIKLEVVRNLDGGRRMLPSSATLWPRLRELFNIINAGSPPLRVATFNGGLFDPERHPFLERHTVGDRHLQEAIDRLARVRRSFVDYRDLSERHLGTIYEGLLEYHLAPALSDDGWSVDLLPEGGERKATGSYYTPDYIVKYMVDQTVGPLLRAAVASAATPEDKIAAVLAVNVLDPAMGSGHFLVEATEYIARFLVELGVLPETEGRTEGRESGSENELGYWKRRVVQSCIYGVDMNPLAVELAKLSLWLGTVAKGRPLSFLDHHLRAGNSLAGARIADLQVGGGRGTGKKTARKAQQQVEAGQLSMLDTEAFRQSMMTAVDSMWLIESSPARTVEQVKEQEQIYAALREELTRKYAHLADLLTATRFGLEIDPALWGPLADYAAGRSLAAPAKFDEWLGAARIIGARHRFFHWELEFPEVYFDRHGNHRGEGAGFDAVVGNPPYVRQEALGPMKPYFAAAYPETHHGVADLYVYFFHQGLRQTRAGGRMSYIVTNKWMRAGYGEPLRAYFASQGALEGIIDFGHAPIFEAADVFPCIVALVKREVAEPAPLEPASERQVRVVAFPRAELNRVDLARYVADHSHTVPHSRFGKSAWTLGTSAVDDLMEKIRRNGVPLAEYAGVKPYYGIKTGLNEAFLIDTPTKDRLVREDSRSAEIIKPYLRGQDIKRWAPEWQGLWMIFARRGIDIDSYPAIKQHLLQFRERLEPGPKDLSGGSRSGRKPGAYKWYEIQDSVDYWPVFEQPKIITQDLATYSWFCFDDSGLYPVNTCYVWPTGDLYMLGWLCSPVAWWIMHRTLQHSINDTLRMFREQVETLPIAPPTDAIRAEAEPAVERLIAITRANQEARRDTLDWLRTEFGVETPGQRLEAFAAFDSDAFVEEVRKRRPRTAGRLTPAALRDLRNGYTEQATPVQQRQADAALLERRLSYLVNASYNLTSEEIELLWSTAPPRMPAF